MATSNLYYNISDFLNKISNFDKATTFKSYKENFKDFESFLKSSYMNSNQILIADSITNDKWLEFFYQTMVFDKKYLKNWNFLIMENILHFWDIDGNYQELDKSYKDIIKKQKKTEDLFLLDYFKIHSFKRKQEKKEQEEVEKLYVQNSMTLSSKRRKPIYDNEKTYLKIMFLSDYIPFYPKEIIHNWVKLINLKFEKLFFNIGMDKSVKDIKVNIYQFLLNNTGIYKNINFNYRINSENSIINYTNVRMDYLTKIDDLKYFTLDSNFKKMQNELSQEHEDETFKIFGDIYFEINTKQSYIINKFISFLNEIGISVSIVHKNNMFDEKSYNVFDIQTLYKFNLKDVK